jgi:hypothetical protein
MERPVRRTGMFDLSGQVSNARLRIFRRQAPQLPHCQRCKKMKGMNEQQSSELSMVASAGPQYVEEVRGV